jgi:mannose/fructose/N-acetylgalactosamine-specific phosphotransferase system component IIC
MPEPASLLAVMLLAALAAQDTTAGPQIMLSEPLVAGTLTGLLMGDPQAGVLIGIAIELVWCRAVPAGTALFLDVSVASVVSVVLGVGLGSSLGLALAVFWVIPVGLLGCGFTMLERRLNGTLVALVKPESASTKRIYAIQASGWLLSGVRGVVVFGIGLVAGTVVLPPVAQALSGLVDPSVAWAAIFGTGGGIAVVSTWKLNRGSAALAGLLIAAGMWVAGLLPGMPGVP